MAADPIAIQSFVPAQLINWLEERGTTPNGPVSEKQLLITWFADLSNFSLLTHQITERERGGPEVVGDLLNQSFGTIIETVDAYGGDVFEFAGDSVLATWNVDPDGANATTQLALASKCGLEVLELELPTLYEEFPSLDLRVAIGFGEGILMQLGGVDGAWEFAAGGPAFDQIGLASTAARPGEVLLSPEALRATDHQFGGHVDRDGFMRLTTVNAHLMKPERSPAALGADRIEELRHYLAPTVLRRLDAGQSEWLAEFRQVTSVFVNLPSLDLGQLSGREALQDVVAEFQRVLKRFEGSLTRILDDDKGVTIVASFGLPPFAHEEDPYLATQAAEAIQDVLRQMRLDYGIGVATGRAFCGACGSPRRRDYTTIGREVNLAARLMQAARFEILCDETTARSARRVEFHPMGRRELRGWDQPVDVFKPLWEKRGRADESEHGRLVGRDSEQNQLTAWLGALVRAHSSAVVVIEGDAGIGKSALAADLIRTASPFDVHALVGDALPVAQAPYQAWRSVISEVLGLGEIRSIERRQEMVRERISQWPEFSEWEALLNSVLDLQFPENATTRGMSGDNRRESTVELLVAILSQAASESPLLIVLDDLHWFDSASWAVTLAASRKVSPLLLVLLTRPAPELSKQLDQIAEIGTSAHLVLKPLDRDDALTLARETLGVDEIGPDAADLILETAEGVPFYIEELSLALRDSDAIEIDGRAAELSKPADQLGVPHTLSSVVLSRIDRLEPDLQLTLKVAAVIGRSFDARVLEAAHPSHPSVTEVNHQLGRLKELDLIVESSPGSYDFKHALTRETAYDLLLFDQRRRIHRSVGTFLEQLGEDSREPIYGLLAYHWDRAEDRHKALTYHEMTGASSLRKGANREAIEAHSRSIELYRENPGEFGDINELRQSQWHVEIGQALEALGEFDDAEQSLFRALDIVGVHTGTGGLRRSGRLIWEIVKQLAHILVPAAIRVPASENERARLAQASRASALLGEIYYFQGDVYGFPLLNLLAINLGERSGEPLVAGLAYSNLGYLVGTLRLRALAGRYFRRARAAEEMETHPNLVDLPYVLEMREMGPGHLIAVALAESVLALTFDEWARAREIVTEGLARCERLGDKYSAGIALAVRGIVNYSSGRIEDARLDYSQLLVSARQRGNREHEGWATSFSIPVLLALGRVDEAREMAAAAIGILDHVDSLTVPIIHGTRSQVQLATGHKREAKDSIEQAVAGIDRTPIFVYLVGFAGLLETVIALFEATDKGGRQHMSEHGELKELARRGLKKLRGFARVLPFARPKYWLYRGRLERIEGRLRRARRSLEKGVALATSSGFKWDEGLLHLELARLLDETDARRATHLERARQLLGEVGSTRDLEKAEELSVQR